MSVETANHESSPETSERFLFPPWANYLVPGLVIVAIGVLTYIPLVTWLFLSPETTDVGYRPAQPVPFSHKLHAGDLEDGLPLLPFNCRVNFLCGNSGYKSLHELPCEHQIRQRESETRR